LALASPSTKTYAHPDTKTKQQANTYNYAKPTLTKFVAYASALQTQEYIQGINMKNNQAQ
jgi:hypothetical protein